MHKMYVEKIIAKANKEAQKMLDLEKQVKSLYAVIKKWNQK